MNLNVLYNDIVYNVKKLNYKDLTIFLIPFLIFSIYLYIYNPGIVTADSFYQLHQIALNSFNNWHPFFHTFIEMLCLKIYPSTITIAVLQIFVFSIMWMIICKYNRGDENQKNNKFILQAAFTLIICLIPINAIYSITLWKDILFSYFLMFLCFLIQVMLDKKGKINYKFIILMSLVMAFVSQLRGNGLYIIIIMLIILSFYLFKMNKKSPKISILLPSLTIIFIVLFASLNVIYDVNDNAKDMMFDKTTHMLADYDLNIPITYEDKQTIHKLISEKDIKENYNIYYSDQIYAHANKQVFDDNKYTYYWLAFEYSLEQPVNALHYIFETSAMVWDITRDADWVGKPYYLLVNEDPLVKDKNSYFTKYKTRAAEDYENVSLVNYGTSEYNLLNSFVTTSESNLILDTLFNSPALYMYLALILMFLIYMSTNSKGILLVYLPNLLNIVIIFASTPIQQGRYLYANLLVFYLLVIIYIGLSKSKNKSYYITAQNPNVYEEDNLKYDNLDNPIETKNNMKNKKDETQEEMEKRIRMEIMNEINMKKKKD